MRIVSCMGMNLFAHRTANSLVSWLSYSPMSVLATDNTSSLALRCRAQHVWFAKWAYHWLPVPWFRALRRSGEIPRWDRARRRSVDGITMEWVVSDANFLLIGYWKPLPTVQVVLKFIINSWASSAALPVRMIDSLNAAIISSSSRALLAVRPRPADTVPTMTFESVSWMKFQHWHSWGHNSPWPICWRHFDSTVVALKCGELVKVFTLVLALMGLGAL